ncbi:24944_t:CDS:1, partial [Dentiscutata erythropus]
MYCSNCKCNHSEDRFIWEGTRHKTCGKCKPAATTNSTIESARQPEDIDYDTIDIQEEDINDIVC